MEEDDELHNPLPCGLRRARCREKLVENLAVVATRQARLARDLLIEPRLLIPIRLGAAHSRKRASHVDCVRGSVARVAGVELANLLGLETRQTLGRALINKRRCDTPACNSQQFLVSRDITGANSVTDYAN